MESNYDRTKAFKFNLVPPKSKKELAQLEQRDNTILYSFLLIFFSAFVFFILTMIQSFVVDPALVNAKGTVLATKTQIASYSSVRRTNGELFTKSQALEPLLDKDIKLDRLVRIADGVLSENVGTVNIQDYEREAAGNFVLTFTLSNPDLVASVIELLSKQEGVGTINLRNIGVDINTGQETSLTVSFIVENI